LEIWKFNMHIQDDLVYTYSQSCIALSNRILIQTDIYSSQLKKKLGILQFNMHQYPFFIFRYLLGYALV
jgi:hypothetical protein